LISKNSDNIVIVLFCNENPKSMSYEDEFGELVLVAGDFHIPSRVADLPH
jgi:hypothetical protein